VESSRVRLGKSRFQQPTQNGPTTIEARHFHRAEQRQRLEQHLRTRRFEPAKRVAREPALSIFSRFQVVLESGCDVSTVIATVDGSLGFCVCSRVKKSDAKLIIPGC